MKIAEIYAGIEGEGSRIGYPQIFIRTQGCSVGCKWCDTKYATEHYKAEEIIPEEVAEDGKIIKEKKVIEAGPGKELSPSEILNSLEQNKLNIKNVSITGGNPMEQEDLKELIQLLIKKNYSVSLECTGQEYDEEVFRLIDFISCDIKTPSSGIEFKLENIKKILKKYDFKTQFKAVIANKKDLDFMVDVYRELKKSKHFDLNLIFTPCWPEKAKNFDKKLMEIIQSTIYKNSMDVRVILQQHKVIYGAEKQGV